MSINFNKISGICGVRNGFLNLVLCLFISAFSQTTDSHAVGEKRGLPHSVSQIYLIDFIEKMVK
jgi:hypothetical protein